MGSTNKIGSRMRSPASLIKTFTRGPKTNINPTKSLGIVGNRGILVVRIKNEETLQPNTLIPKLIDVIKHRFTTLERRDQTKHDPAFHRYLHGY